MTSRSRNVPDEELFPRRPGPDEDCDSHTVGPLRLLKPQSRQAAADKASHRFKHPVPPSSSTNPSLTGLPPLPSFPWPAGASSSAAPLPYPDEDGKYPKPSRPSRPPNTDQAWTSADSTGRVHSPPPASSGSYGYQNHSPGLTASRGEKKGGLAERRGGTAPKPLQSRDSAEDDRDELYVRPLKSSAGRPSRTDSDESGMNRLGSTASISTTRASRGSPPPPETPITEPGSDTNPLASLQAPSGQGHSAAAQTRLAQYGGQRTGSQGLPVSNRPWTPTESPDQQPFGPPTVYQGSDIVTRPSASRHHTNPSGSHVPVSVLEQDFQRLQASTPPPAYTTVTSAANSQSSQGKQRPAPSSSRPTPSAHATHAIHGSGSGNVAPKPGTAANASTTASHPVTSAPDSPEKPKVAAVAAPHGHPALARENRPELGRSGQTVLTHTPSLLAAAQSPPPLPEGWIAHLDQNSGQYYYIHLATQATQWEFPKGPNPIHHEPAPLSPTASTYGNPLASPFLAGGNSGLGSPMFPPRGYAESIMSVATTAASGFTGPPPSAGVDLFKIAPSNGVYFGPYLRYVNMELEKGIWLGSIMIVTDAPQPPTVHLHLSHDLSPNPRQLVPCNLYSHQRWNFFRYDMDLPMSENGTERWTYAVTSHLGCTRYEFVVAGRHEVGWRMMAHSGNDFAPSTNQNERSKLGGVGLMWKDMLQKHVDCGGFHVQLGLGNQVYGDRLWKDVPLLKQWLAMPGREKRKNAPWTARHEEDVGHAYFHYYTSHFDQPFMREAFAQVPHVLQVDDHDIFDGFGSYPDYIQSSAMFKNIGRIAIEMYLLFQHHTTVEILRNVSSDMDLFTITASGWHFVKYLGPSLVVVGPDMRSERNQARVLAGQTYQGIFPRVAMLPPSVQHCIWMLSLPVLYPRLETMETLANTFATGKKAVNTTYNILGKLTSSVAGVVGGKEMVAQGFKEVKKAVGKTGLMGGVLNQFGDVDIAEELKDLWTHESKDLERTYLIRTLQGIAQQKNIRMTFLSGGVRCCGAGLVHDPSHPSDFKTMYQLITSAIVAAPASNYLLKMLHNNKTLYVPLNGHKSTHELSDTKEDMMEIFHTDASGGARELKKLMNRRNYMTMVAYDPGAATTSQYAGSVHSGSSGGPSKLSLAVDFVVQADGAFTAPTKYGPVIVPHLG